MWLANKIFEEDVIEPLLQHCRATGLGMFYLVWILKLFIIINVLEVDTEKVEMIVKGEKANMQIYGAEASISPPKKTLPLKKLPKTPPKPRTPPLELRVCF